MARCKILPRIPHGCGGGGGGGGGVGVVYRFDRKSSPFVYL